MNIPETEKKKREQEGAQQELPRAETKVEPPSAPLAAAASEQQTSQHETTASGPDSGQEKHFAPKKLFGIDSSQEDTDATDVTAAILADVPQEDKQTLYKETMKYLAGLYGENTDSSEESAAE